MTRQTRSAVIHGHFYQPALGSGALTGATIRLSGNLPREDAKISP